MVDYLKFEKFLVSDILTVFSWFIIAWCFSKIIGIRFTKKNSLIIYFICTFVLLISIFIIDIKSISDIRIAQEKYISSSIELVQILKNAEYQHCIYNAIFDYFSILIILLSFFISTPNKNTEGNENNQRPILAFIARAIIITILFNPICVLKMIIIPQNSLINVHGSGTDSSGISFSLSNVTTKMNRALNNYNSKEIYCKTDFIVCYQENQLIDFKLNGEYNAPIYADQNKEIAKNDWYKAEINGIEINIFYNCAFAYLKDDIPYGKTFSSLPKEKYDEVVLNLCKYMLEQSKLDCFEYTCEYVMKYDPEFAKPYIQRYKAGNFTASEYENDMNINTDYITAQANRISQKYIQGK